MSSTRLYKNVYSIEWDGHAHMHILNKCFVTVKWMPAYFPENDYDQFVRNVCMLFRDLFVFKNVLIKWSWFLPLIVGYCLTQIIMILVTHVKVFYDETTKKLLNVLLQLFVVLVTSCGETCVLQLK